MIDGGNFYYKFRELSLPNVSQFDYRGLSSWLARNRHVVSVSYYIGVVRAKNNDLKGQALRRQQQKLFAHLESDVQNVSVKRGYIMHNEDGYHEKGVDVQIAADLITGALKNQYDTAIVLSSDTDLLPAIEIVRAEGKNVEYIGFAHKPSLAMQKYASLSRLLIKEELLPFVREK